ARPRTIGHRRVASAGSPRAAARSPSSRVPKRSTPPAPLLDRALWVVRDKVTAKAAIDDLMADAATRGIHDVVVQVRGRGDAYYRSTLEPRAESLAPGGWGQGQGPRGQGPRGQGPR